MAHHGKYNGGICHLFRAGDLPDVWIMICLLLCTALRNMSCFRHSDASLTTLLATDMPCLRHSDASLTTLIATDMSCLRHSDESLTILLATDMPSLRHYY